MEHNISLITMLAGGFGMALICGFLAEKLKLPALVGYLLAGIIIGPATPGFVADMELAPQLLQRWPQYAQAHLNRWLAGRAHFLKA